MRVLQRCIYSITSRDEFIIRLGAIGKETELRSRTCSTSQALYILQRERFVGTYSSQVAIEVPYIIIQVVICGMITYLAIGFHLSVYKLIWYIGTLLFVVLSFTHIGMLFMPISLSIHVANVYSSTFIILNNVFTGFLIPRTVSRVYRLIGYFGTMFFAVLSFTYIGMLFVSISPSLHVANVYSSTFIILNNVFTGFSIPRTVS